jgi:hypothetical protein
MNEGITHFLAFKGQMNRVLIKTRKEKLIRAINWILIMQCSPYIPLAYILD